MAHQRSPLTVSALLLFLSSHFIALVAPSRICPQMCSCISNAEYRPDIEETIVDCAYKKLSRMPSDLPHSTTEGNKIDTLDTTALYGVAFSSEGTPMSVSLQKLRVLRVDKNPLTNITGTLLNHANFASLQWIYVPLGMRVLEQKPLQLVDLGVPSGWRELPSSPLENKEYKVWIRETVTAFLDSVAGIEA